MNRLSLRNDRLKFYKTAGELPITWEEFIEYASNSYRKTEGCQHVTGCTCKHTDLNRLWCPTISPITGAKSVYTNYGQVLHPPWNNTLQHQGSITSFMQVPLLGFKLILEQLVHGPWTTVGSSDTHPSRPRNCQSRKSQTRLTGWPRAPHSLLLNVPMPRPLPPDADIQQEVDNENGLPFFQVPIMQIIVNFL